LRTTNHETRATNTGHLAVRSSGAFHAEAGRGLAVRDRSSGFTLIELILVMALLVVAVSLVSPHLKQFFQGRTLNDEAKQIISLMHDGQSRAVSAGVPMVLWFDADNKKYGLEEEPGYVDKDPKAVEFDLNGNLKIEVPDYDASTASLTGTSRDTRRQGLPQIVFLSDGTIAEGSPRTVRIIDNDGPMLSLTQSRNRNEYEIATTTGQ
jgi:prepilin-type N-terminal cleavage/methylation domain-containing protein